MIIEENSQEEHLVPKSSNKDCLSLEGLAFLVLVGLLPEIVLSTVVSITPAEAEFNRLEMKGPRLGFEVLEGNDKEELALDDCEIPGCSELLKLWLKAASEGLEVIVTDSIASLRDKDALGIRELEPKGETFPERIDTLRESVKTGVGDWSLDGNVVSKREPEALSERVFLVGVVSEGLCVIVVLTVMAWFEGV